MEDEQIINLYFARDESAIRETERKYKPYCFTVSNNILGDIHSAEECVNDTWLETWNTIPPQKPSVLKLFLAKITRNLSLDYFRKAHAQKRGAGQIPLILDELAEVVPSNVNFEEELYYKELLHILNDFLLHLADGDKMIFLQRYFYASPIKEIASNSNCSYNTLNVRLHRLRKRLKVRLKSEGYYEER